jgi:predicted ester cyclase
MTDNYVRLARELFTVLETGDATRARQVVAASFSNREATAGPPACSEAGPAGALASSAWLRTAFSELRFSIADVGRDGPRVWLRLRMQGLHTGPFVQFENGRPARILPPTGRRIDVEQIHVMEVTDAGVIRHEAVRDDVTMLGQLGVFPPGPKFVLSLLGWKISGRARRAVRSLIALTETAAAEATTSRRAPAR